MKDGHHHKFSLLVWSNQQSHSHRNSVYYHRRLILPIRLTFCGKWQLNNWLIISDLVKSYWLTCFRWVRVALCTFLRPEQTRWMYFLTHKPCEYDSLALALTGPVEHLDTVGRMCTGHPCAHRSTAFTTTLKINESFEVINQDKLPTIPVSSASTVRI